MPVCIACNHGGGGWRPFFLQFLHISGFYTCKKTFFYTNYVKKFFTEKMYILRFLLSRKNQKSKKSKVFFTNNQDFAPQIGVMKFTPKCGGVLNISAEICEGSGHPIFGWERFFSGGRQETLTLMASARPQPCGINCCSGLWLAFLTPHAPQHIEDWFSRTIKWVQLHM